MALLSEKALGNYITSVINNAAAEIREATIAKAVAEFEKELRKRVGEAAITASDYYSITRDHTEVLIRVRVEDPKES